tara:strand:- start:149 stop:586 length:438 start_codon:yes stop_codon:yes gene_type:complete
LHVLVVFVVSSSFSSFVKDEFFGSEFDEGMIDDTFAIFFARNAIPFSDLGPSSLAVVLSSRFSFSSSSSSSSSPIGDAGAIIAFNLFVVECVDFPEGPDDPLPNKARVRIAKALFLFAFDPPRLIAAKALLPPSNHHRFAVVVVA